MERLGFALALAGDPSVLFLDGPTVGMDITARQHFWETVRGLAASGRTIILTTHYLEEADSIADRIVVINKGKLIADGSSAEIKASTNQKTILFTAGPQLTAHMLDAIPMITNVTWSGRKVKIISRTRIRSFLQWLNSSWTSRILKFIPAVLKMLFNFWCSNNFD